MRKRKRKRKKRVMSSKQVLSQGVQSQPKPYSQDRLINKVTMRTMERRKIKMKRRN